MSIRTIIADDHHMMRHMIRRLLEREGDIEVIGEAANGQEAVQLVEREQPDVLITDMAMPRLSGLDVIKRLTSDDHKTRTLAISMYRDATVIRKALAYGAGGFVVKQSMFGHLGLAVRSAFVGKLYLCPIAERALKGKDKSSSTQDKS